MKQEFVAKRFRDDSLALIDNANRIIEKYQKMGFTLTLRQLYYQLVTLNIIPNSKQSYKNLSSLLTDARMAGLVDWNALEDRTRVARAPNEYESLNDLMQAAFDSYRLPRRANQPNHVELWVEKDALSELCGRVAGKHHVALSVNKGYSSASAMYTAARRLRWMGADKDKTVILYLGDHDPSGEDMVRDIQDRLNVFGVDVTVEKIALTREQVDQYNLPPNPVKDFVNPGVHGIDSRAEGYKAIHGKGCWELDALRPDVLMQLAEDAIASWTDQSLIDEVIEREDKHKEKLQEAVDRIEKETEDD